MNAQRSICLLVLCVAWVAAPAQRADDSADLDRYVGRYSGYSGSESWIEVTHEEGRLFFQPAGQGKVPATLEDDGAFQLENAPIRVTFAENEEGAVESFTYNQGGRGVTLTRADVLDAAYEAVATKVRPHGLSDAVLKGDLASARVLIDKGIDVEELDTRPGIGGNNGRRPLNWAALRNDTAMIELLLDAGAGINETNGSGFTPLHHAAEAGAAEAAALLIEKGADLHRTTARGDTPIDVAVALNRIEVFAALRTASNVERCGEETCPQSEPTRDADVSELVDRLDADVPGYLEQFTVPGAAVAVIRNGEIAVSKGYGFADVENRVAVTPATGFNVGSISKTVAAWGVMTLVEQGELELDAPVSRYLTRWQLPESEFDEDGVTIRRLLSHTAGLSLHGYPGFGPDDALPTMEESLSGATNGSGGVELVMEPGTQWRYSGGGYTLAQLIVEEVTGRSFADYLREAVLRPLGMADSDFHLSEELMAKSSLAYDERGVPTPNPRFTAQAAAGLHTTVEDLATFAAAALTADDGRMPGRDVLSAETVDLMLSPAPASDGSYGLGYAVSLTSLGYQGRGHGGSNRGWQAYFKIVPETGDGIVVLTNASRGSGLHQALVRAWDGWLAGRD